MLTSCFSRISSNRANKSRSVRITTSLSFTANYSVASMLMKVFNLFFFIVSQKPTSLFLILSSINIYAWSFQTYSALSKSFCTSSCALIPDVNDIRHSLGLKIDGHVSNKLEHFFSASSSKVNLPCCNSFFATSFFNPTISSISDLILATTRLVNSQP